MATHIRWLRASYWTGAIVDAFAAAAMLIPGLGNAIYGRPDFVPGPDYRYAMYLGGSLMVAWTALLLWADRKPVERRGVLMLTVGLICGLIAAGIFAVSSGLIAPGRMTPTWILQAFLIALFSFSYWRSRPSARGKADSGARADSLATAAAEFLALQSFAVAGVSREGSAAANLIYRKLRDSGRTVYATNPNAAEVEGDRCYPSLRDIPSSVEAVMVATHPDRALDIARECKDIGARFVWFHKSIDAGSLTPEAVAFCKAYGANVIPGGCPMMHLAPVDFPHRCMRGVLGALGKLPNDVEIEQAVKRTA